MEVVAASMNPGAAEREVLKRLKRMTRKSSNEKLEASSTPKEEVMANIASSDKEMIDPLPRPAM
jgi:hypothetical protein